MANFGIKVSQPGVNVQSATEDQLYWTSKYDTLKAKQISTASISFPPGAGPRSATIAHGLGYVPAFFGYRIGTPYQILPYRPQVYVSYSAFLIAADATNITITINGFNGSPGTDTFNFKVYIFYNQLD
jgi:hypothetical protein